MYDFVVVGLGPAGSRFARRAAEEGYDVIGFEQGQVGEPLACSGHVSTDVWEITGDGAREELLQNEVYGARFHVDGPAADGGAEPNGGKGAANAAGDERTPDDSARTEGHDLDGAYPFYKDEPVSNVIDRVGLDRHLADLAREAGADCREEHTVTAVEEHADHVTATVRGPDGTETFDAKMVAGCDGPRSRVRDALDLPEPDEFLHGVLGFTDDPDHADFVDVHLTPPRFFAWRIPRGDAGVEFGLATPPDQHAGEAFESFCEAYGVEVSRRCSGAIPIGPPSEVTGDRGFLIGDAAGQTKPFTGGGIRYGTTCADHAIATIDPDDPGTLADYETAWRDDLAREIRLGHAIRRAYSLPTTVQRAGLRAFSGEIGVHMDRPTSLFSAKQLRALLP
ncbi:geranylgeranyl reductase [Salinarchaeum sp. Harcht-Bsk1]|uniref:FAD-dependent monooxygenase n=1 Tax=Salinarchaeum sp. Harcht-Bsk1 TaxID=1333523 RepID=UPI0003423BD2|nr:FAD-dependent monooxygenase [Salinarchaeum sp. Harcht-Bsk1]AGN02108.1 geranylgeranyl reductase [Salinarchaeum sp. Harcht-Bsk1]